MLREISREEAKELMKLERYQDMLKAYESKALEYNFAPPPHLVEEMKMQFFIKFYSNAYLRKYPGRVYDEETVSSSVVSAPKVSSDAISNDTDKDPAITDIAGGTGVAIELLKEDTNLSESTDLISSNNVNFVELSENSDEILPTISTNSCNVNDTEQFGNEGQDSTDINEEENPDEKASVTSSDIANKVDEDMSVTDEDMSVTDDATYLSIDNAETNSYNVNDTEQFDNEGQDSSNIDEEKNLEEDASVTISDNKIDIAEEPSVDNILEALPNVAPSSTNDECVVKCPAVDTKSPFASFVGVFTSAWYSLTKMFHSKTESTGDAVFDSLPRKSSFFGDNLNDDVDTIGGISEVNNNLFDQD